MALSASAVSLSLFLGATLYVGLVAQLNVSLILMFIMFNCFHRIVGRRVVEQK